MGAQMADFRPPPGKWQRRKDFFLFFKKVTVADFSALPAIIRKCTQNEEGFPRSRACVQGGKTLEVPFPSVSCDTGESPCLRQRSPQA